MSVQSESQPVLTHRTGLEAKYGQYAVISVSAPAAEYAQVQDGPPRHPRARQTAARRLTSRRLPVRPTRPSQQLGQTGQSIGLSPKALTISYLRGAI